MKKALFIFFIIPTMVFSQTSSNKASLRYYLGQSKTFLNNAFTSCHIQDDTQTGGSFWVSCASSSDQYIFNLNKNGLVRDVNYITTNIGNASVLFSSEVALLMDNGWEITKQSTDKIGNLFYTYNRNGACIELIYSPVVGGLGIKICE